MAFELVCFEHVKSDHHNMSSHQVSSNTKLKQKWSRLTISDNVVKAVTPF